MSTQKTIGITGSTGTLGRIMVQQLTELGYYLELFTGDLRNAAELDQWLLGKHLDAVIHLAALVPVKQVMASPAAALDINLGCTMNLLSSLTKHNQAPWFFYASSSHVYQPSSEALTETSPTGPFNAYGATKLLGEQVANFYAQYVGTKVCIGRIFSFYHPTQHEDFLYPALLKRLASEDLSQDFFLRGVKSQRDFLPAETVVELIIKLLAQEFVGTVNIASGRSTTIADFAQSLSDQPLKIVTDEESNCVVANIDLLNTII